MSLHTAMKPPCWVALRLTRSHRPSANRISPSRASAREQSTKAPVSVASVLPHRETQDSIASPSPLKKRWAWALASAIRPAASTTTTASRELWSASVTSASARRRWLTSRAIMAWMLSRMAAMERSRLPSSSRPPAGIRSSSRPLAMCSAAAEAAARGPVMRRLSSHATSAQATIASTVAIAFTCISRATRVRAACRNVKPSPAV